MTIAPGIDLSHHNTVRDWSAVARSARFVMLKATGVNARHELHTDARFADYRARARTAGMLVGSYHYARFGRAAPSPEAQADYHVAVLGPARFDDLPVWCDVEELGDGLGTAERARHVLRFLERVEARTGRRAGWYSYPSFLGALGPLDGLRARPYWAADYDPARPAPRVGWVGRWDVRQTTSRGTVPGIVGRVDLDVIPGMAELVRLTHRPLATWAALEALAGFVEDDDAPNANPYAARARHPDRQPWCATFVSAGCRETGTVGVLDSASTLRQIARARLDTRRGVAPGRWHEGLDGLDAGDVVYRLRKGGGHVEVALGPVDRGRFPSVGGNTTGAPDVDWNGGAVVRQARSTAGWIGYIRPTRPDLSRGVIAAIPPTPPEVPEMVGTVVRLPDGRIVELVEVRARHVHTPAEVESLLAAGAGPQAEATPALAARVVVA